MTRTPPLYSLLSVLSLLVAAANVARAEESTDERTVSVPDVAGEDRADHAARFRRLPWWVRQPILLNFDSLPSAPWELNPCGDLSTMAVSHGILTIDSP